MAAEFLIEEGFGHPLCAANCHIPDTSVARQLSDWVMQGGVLLARPGKTVSRIVPGVIPGLRSNKAGVLIHDRTPRIRATRCVTKALVDIIYELTVDTTHEFGIRHRGKMASRPKRYNRSSNDPPPALETFASPELIEALDRKEGPDVSIYWLAERSPTDPSKGFEPVIGGLALYSLVETEVLGVMEVLDPLAYLGLGFYVNATDPITDPQIATHYKENGIRSSELTSNKTC